MEFADSDWHVMIAATIAALHAENGYPLTASTAGHMDYLAREVPGTDVNTLRTWLQSQPHPAPVPVPVPVPVPTPTPVPVPTPTPHPSGPMPNRSQEVRMVCDLHPEVFQQPNDEALNAARLNLLRTQIIPTLNALDGGGWGLLMKTDQGNKIPVDILCWYPGTEYADVMTGTGANWQRWENPNPSKWIWVPAQS